MKITFYFSVEEYRKYLFEPNSNHIGIAGNSEKIVIVYLTSFKALTIS